MCFSLTGELLILYSTCLERLEGKKERRVTEKETDCLCSLQKGVLSGEMELVLRCLQVL
jgi:hypothetical protein